MRLPLPKRSKFLAGTDYAVDANADSDRSSRCWWLPHRGAAAVCRFDAGRRHCDVSACPRGFCEYAIGDSPGCDRTAVGLDYSNEGNVPAEEFEEIFEQENYERLPEYLQDAVEAAVLGYYENKDIRRIDYEIDRCRSNMAASNRHRTSESRLL